LPHFSPLTDHKTPHAAHYFRKKPSKTTPSTTTKKSAQKSKAARGTGPSRLQDIKISHHNSPMSAHAHVSVVPLKTYTGEASRNAMPLRLARI